MAEGSQSLYEQIFEYYRARILAGRLAPGDRLPTERDLMERFSVSRITARRALDELEQAGLIFRRRGSGSYVADPKKDAARSRCVGFVIPDDAGESPFLRFVQGATEVLTARGLQLALYAATSDEKDQLQALLQARGDGCDGILFYPGPLETARATLFNMAAVHYPLVVLDKQFSGLPVSYVASDNVAGARALGEYLLQKGHRKLAYLSPDVNLGTTTGQRYMGFCQAVEVLAPGEGTLVHRAVFESSDEYESSISRYEAALAERLPPLLDDLHRQGVTAVCAMNDYIAMRVAQALRSLGLSAPADMAVTGFDDVEYARYADPPLTTVRQDFAGMGAAAAREICRLIARPDAAPKQIVLPTEPVFRTSA